MEDINPDELYKLAHYTIKLHKIPYSEDLVQEMVTYASDALKTKYDENRAKKTTFICNMMYYRWAHIKRKEKAAKTIPVDLVYSLDRRLDMTDTTDDLPLIFLNLIEDKYVYKEKARKVCNDAIEYLKGKMHKFTFLRLQGLTCKEIASMSKVSQSYVNAVLRQDEVRLKKVLVDAGLYDYFKNEFIKNYFKD